jgi:hypothetical protein
MADDKKTEEKTMRLWVASVSKDGFRRLGRWFGPSWTEVEVTEAQAAELVTTQRLGQLKLLTPEAKDQLDAIEKRQAEATARLAQQFGRAPGEPTATTTGTELPRGKASTSNTPGPAATTPAAGTAAGTPAGPPAAPEGPAAARREPQRGRGEGG